MTQRKFVFMKFEDSLFLHFSEFFGEGAPVEVQVVGEALAVEGDRKGVGAGFGGKPPEFGMPGQRNHRAWHPSHVPSGDLGHGRGGKPD